MNAHLPTNPPRPSRLPVVAAMLALLSGLPAGGQASTSLRLDRGSEALNGPCSSMATVNGNPAVAYKNVTDGNLMFARNSAADGSGSWSVVIATKDALVGTYISLVVVNGIPAISYSDVTSGELKSVRATDANGTIWGTPTTLNSELKLAANATPVSTEVAVTGKQAADLTAATQTTPPMATTSDTTSFQAPWDTNASSLRTTTLSIDTNDSDEPPFDFTIQANGANSAPTDIALANATLAENAGADASVGTLSTTDADLADVHAYSLVAGAGDTDNAAFNLSGNTLRMSASADFEAKSIYNIRLQTSDGTDTFSKAFTITISDVNELPVFVKGADQSPAMDDGAAQSIPGWATGIDDGDSAAVQALSFTVTEVGASGMFNVAPAISSVGTLTFTLNPFSLGGTATFQVTLTDDTSINGLPALTTAPQSFTITFDRSISIVDDGGPGYTDSGLAVSTTAGRKGDQRELPAAPPGQSATWTFTGLLPNTRYKIGATWQPVAGATSAAPFSVYRASVSPANLSGTVLMDQTSAPDDYLFSSVAWEDFGYVYMADPSGTFVVRLDAPASGIALADSVRLIPLSGPEIQLTDSGAGNANVPNGRTVHVGSTALSTPVTRDLVVRNLGTSVVSIGSVGISGPDAADFSVSISPASTIGAGSTTPLQITMTPSVIGPRSATVTFTTTDSDENPFRFIIQGTAGSLIPFVLGQPGSTGGGSGSGTIDAPNADATASLGKWESIRAGAVLSSNGHIAFRAHMELGSGTPPVTVSDFQGIWRYDGVDTRLQARSGSTAPESGGALYDMLPLNPSISPDGLITFYGALRMGSGSPAVTGAINTGLWSELGGGTVRLLLRKGDLIISGKTYRSGFAVTTSTVNTAALNAKLSSGSALLHIDVNTPAVQLTAVAEEGQAAPGGGTWIALDGNSSDPRLSANGDLGFIGWELVGSAYIQGIYSRLGSTSVGTSGAVVQARVGGSAPGTSGATFSAFERPTVYNGGMAFRGFLNLNGDNAGGTKGQGLWAGAFGSLLPVVRTGDTSAQIATIPAGSAVTSVWSPFSNGVGAITMRVGLSNGVSETRAIMGSTSGTMQVIAKAGDAAPGLAGETFTNFDHPVIGDGNQVAFTASTNAGSYGIWKQAPGGGALSLVMKVGHTISTSEGDKVVSQIILPGATTDDRKFEARCMDATGRLLIHVTFADGTTSLLLGQ